MTENQQDPNQDISNEISNEINKAHSKSEARLAAVEALFSLQIDSDKRTAKHALADILEYYKEDEIDAKPNKKFLEKIVWGVTEHQENIDELISKHLSLEWKLNRLNLIVQAILRAAVFELSAAEISHKVIINEYIDVAKCFCDDTDVAFINGILDNIAGFLSKDKA